MSRQKKIKKFNIMLNLFTLLIVIVFAFAMYVQASEYFELKDELEQCYSEQYKAVKKNQATVTEMEYHDSDEYIEKIARERLGMVKPNEIVFIDENK